MGDVWLRFTVCWFVDDAYVDVHLAAAPDGAALQRIGRLIFADARALVAWVALAKVLQDHGRPMIDGVSAEICSGSPDTVNYGAIPPAIMAGLQAHVDHGAPTGDYLWAVLKNDLADATARADVSSLAALRDTTSWLCNYAPPECWGTPEKVHQWREAHRYTESLGAAEQGPPAGGAGSPRQEAGNDG